MIDDETDLAEVAGVLLEQFRGDPPAGYLRGRTAFRDALRTRLRCSALEAEELVDTLEARGFLRFDGDRSGRSQADASWRIDADRGG